MTYHQETMIIHPHLTTLKDCKDSNCDLVGKEIALLEKGVDGIVLNSFQGVIITTMLSLTKAGDHVIASDGLPPRIFSIIENVFGLLGIETTIFDKEASLDNIKDQIKDNTKLMLIPSINMPELDVSDIKEYAKLCQEMQIPLIVDNTLATPYIIKPIEHGANIVIENTNPYIGANRDLSAGVLVDGGNFDWAASPRFRTLTSADPNIEEINFYEKYQERAFIEKAAYLGKRRLGYKLRESVMQDIALRIETLDIRLKKISSTAIELANYLSFHPKVEKVFYPLAPSQKHIARDLQYLKTGGAGYINLLVKGANSNNQKVIDNLKIVSVSDTTGTLTTTIPPIANHERLLPISIGLENIEDLKADFEQALDKIEE